MAKSGTGPLIQGMMRYAAELAADLDRISAELAHVQGAIDMMSRGAPRGGAKAPKAMKAAKAAKPARGQRKGRGRPAGDGTALRDGSLKWYIHKVLGESGAPMAVKDVTAAVLSAGFKTENKALPTSIGNALAELTAARLCKRVARGIFALA